MSRTMSEQLVTSRQDDSDEPIVVERTMSQSMMAPVAMVDLMPLVEAMLLVAPGPTTISELAAGADVPAEAVSAALSEIEQRPDGVAGWIVQRHGDAIQLVTAPRFAIQVRRFLGLDREAKLSSAALETLAMIAYQQPITRSEVEAVRGVDCSGVLATLHGRGLIEQVGRVQAPGNPVQYGTTSAFLRHFGLRALADLPPLGQVDGRDAREALAEAVERRQE